MSADGRYVFFGSTKTHLSSGEFAFLEQSDTNGMLDVYVKDRDTGTIKMAYPFVDPSNVTNFQVSGDGRYLAVSVEGSPGCSRDCPNQTLGSWNSDIGTGSSNNRVQIYMVDQQTNNVELVSGASDGSLGNGHSHTCNSTMIYFVRCSSINTDGRYIAFTSKATNLVTGPDGDYWQIYVKDLQLGTTEILSLSSSGDIGNSDSQAPSISGDGRYVVFESKATNLDAIDTSAQTDVYVHDRQTNKTALVSRSYVGGQPNGISGAAEISSNGQYIVFVSGSSNMLETQPATSVDHVYRVANPLW